MTFAALFLAIAFSAIGLIVGLALLIIGLAGDKRNLKIAGVVIIPICLIILIYSIFYSVNRTVSTIKEKIDETTSSMDTTFNDLFNTIDTADLFEDSRDYLLVDSTATPQFRKLTKYSYARNKDSINPDYFIFFGNQTFFRMPLVYPYSIYDFGNRESGTIVDERNCFSIRNTDGKELNIQFKITHLNYDDKLLLTRALTDETEGNEKQFKYYIMDWKTAKIEEFQSEQDLFKSASKKSYKGEKFLYSLAEYDALFQ